MSVAIESTLISTVDKRLVLGNAQWAATLSIGTDWQRILLGCRLAFDDTGANLTGTPRFYFGMMSAPTVGLANGPLGNAVSHFVGVVSTASIWSRNSDSSIRQKYGDHTTVAAKKIGATITPTGSGAANPRYSASPTNYRCAHLVLIQKGSPNFTITQSQATLDSGPADTVYSTLRNAMEINDPTLAGNNAQLLLSSNAYLTTAGYGLAVDEVTNGYLDSICIAWDRVNPLMHVSEILFAKMA